MCTEAIFPAVYVSQLTPSEQRALSAGRRDSKMIVGELRGDASAGCAVQKSNLDEEGFVDFLYCIRFFRERCRQRAHSDRPTLILLDDGEQQLAIDLVESMLVDFEHLERGLGSRKVDLPRAANLGIIADPSQQAIRNAWSATRAAGNFPSAFFVDFDAQNFSRAFDNHLQIFICIKLKPQQEPETRTKRRRKQARAGCSRWTSSINKTCRSRRLVRMAVSSPLICRVGPEVC